MSRPEQANRLLTDDFFKELVESQKLLYKNNIFNSAENDFDIREKSLIKYRAIEEFVASIQAIADEKQIANNRWKIL
jgi:hypothetical protein